MANPWLAIPLDDYEGHMRAPAVHQLETLAELFAQALGECRPRSVAVLGVAGGNGLDSIDTSVTRRIVGLDVNPAYLDAVRQRYAALPGLELHCVDLAGPAPGLLPVELVHAALVFEHAGTGRCLENTLSLVAPGGRLSVILQLPGESQPDVAPSPYASIQELRQGFSLVDPEWFRKTVEGRGFRLERQELRPLRGGKAFWAGVFAPRQAHSTW